MSKTRDTGYLANVIQVHDTGVRIMSGSEMLMAISSSGQVTITGELSGSDAANSLLLDGTGSLAFTTTASFLVVSASQQQISSSLLQVSASYISLSASYTTFSGSASTRISNNETSSNSLTNASASFSTRTTQVEKTYATTGSNTYTGTQNFSSTCTPNGFNSGASIYTAGGLQVTNDAYFSSSVFIKGNVTVYGTQSVAYISSSQLNIGTNTITVNTFTPSVRFGGLSVFDSGSTGLTGSIFWDSELNRWIYVNASGSGGGATYGGGMFISGPRNSVGLGCEQGTTACMLLAGQGGDHLTSSMIYHSSTATCVPNTLIGSTICTTMANASCIGIGTTTPTHPLEIYAATGNQLKISTNDATSANNSGIFFYNEASATSSTRRSYILLDPNGANGSGGDYSYFDMYGSGTTRLMNQLASGLLALGVGGTNIINITGSSVGIGTSSPGAKLEVAGVDENILKLKNTSGQPALVRFNDTSTTGDPYIGSYGNSLAFGIYGVGESIRINSSRNVGIGTITPYQKLVNTGHIALTTACAGTDATADVQRAAIGWQATASDTVLGSFITAANQGNWGSDMQFYTRPSTGGNAVLRLTIANSGAATFCSSVTVNSDLISLAYRGTTAYNYYDLNGAGAHRFRDNNGNNNLVSILNSGNVGIGTVAPCASLHVVPTASNSLIWPVIINNQANCGSAGYGVGLRLQNSSISGGNENNKWAGIAAIAGGSSGYSNDTDLAFYVGCFILASNATCPPVEKMRIQSSTGNVGIGTTSPTAMLDIYHPTNGYASVGLQGYAGGTKWYLTSGISGDTIQDFSISNNNAGTSPKFRISSTGAATFSSSVTAVRGFFNSGGNETDPIISVTGDTNTGFFFPSADTIATTVAGAERARITSGGVTKKPYGNYTEYHASTAYSSQTGVISFGNSYDQANTGDGLIRTYASTLNASPRLYLTSGTGGVYLTLNSTSWTANSDERLKNINGIIENAVDKISTLRAVKYSWKEDDTDKTHLGLIAQDVQKVLPEVVDVNENDEIGTLGVRYTDLIPVLVKAIQEQQCKIALLESCLGIA